MRASEFLTRHGLWTPAGVPRRAASPIVTPGKVISFARAVTSGRCDDAVYHRRLAICESCEHLKREGEKLYCQACGCPEWSLAELHTKLRFARVVCPRGKFT